MTYRKLLQKYLVEPLNIHWNYCSLEKNINYSGGLFYFTTRHDSNIIYWKLRLINSWLHVWKYEKMNFLQCHKYPSIGVSYITWRYYVCCAHHECRTGDCLEDKLRTIFLTRASKYPFYFRKTISHLYLSHDGFNVTIVAVLLQEYC